MMYTREPGIMFIMDAYSMPMTPAPTTMSVRGITQSGRSTSSESKTWRSWKGIWPGRAGRVPVAMSTLSAVMSLDSSLSPGLVDVTERVCGPSNEPWPEITLILLRSSCSATMSRSRWTTADTWRKMSAVVNCRLSPDDLP
eukprot:Amastigsp_a99_392.p5 type:complete len:141 gc:universal Amastigsp_a99_392:805-383(-)